MHVRLCIRLDPDKLDNPDLDLRHLLVDRLREISGGAMSDDGFDYADDSSELLIYLTATDRASALESIKQVVERERFLDNDLAAATRVTAEESGGHQLVYPTADS